MGTVFHFDFARRQMRPINEGGPLPLGTVVSYGDMANPRRRFVVVEGEPKAYGQQCVSIEDGPPHLAQVSRASIDGPGGWHVDSAEPWSPEACSALFARGVAEQQARAERRHQEHLAREADTARGRAIIESIRPAWAERCIMAELERDESDPASDYFATSTARRVLLAWSKTGRDNFAEMRKAAALAPETAHLGPGRDEYTVSVKIQNTVATAGHYYQAGDRSRWHGEPQRLTTAAETEAYIASRPALEPIRLGGTDSILSVAWHTRCESVEHREKYSMGKGFYLKSGPAYGDGWTVRKRPIDLNSLGLIAVRHPGDIRVPGFNR